MTGQIGLLVGLSSLIGVAFGVIGTIALKNYQIACNKEVSESNRARIDRLEDAIIGIKKDIEFIRDNIKRINGYGGQL